VHAALLASHLVLVVAGYGLVYAWAPGGRRSRDRRSLLVGSILLLLGWGAGGWSRGLLKGGLLGLTSTMAAASGWVLVGPFLGFGGEESA